MQLTLFHIIQNAQLSQAAADAGLQLAVDNSERKVKGWQEITYDHFKDFLHDRCEPFMIEDFRSFLAMIDGYEFPDNSRAFGQIARRAATEGLIEFAGYGKVKNVKAHRANAAMWRRKIAS